MTNTLRCNHCNKEFRYESERKRHELSHSPRFKCGICSKKFSFNSALKRHEKQHQRTERAPCKQCGRSFRDDSLLKRHIKYAHKGKYICIKCNAEFHSELALGIHEKIHKPKSERKYHCGYLGCEKTFNFPHHLKHHEMTHTDSKQYYCEICEKGFIQLHHLKSHLKTHEPESWLHCTEIKCNKKFPTQYSKKRHLLRVHNIKLHDVSIPDPGQIESDIESDVNIKCDGDTVLCTTCGEFMDVHVYEEHESKCNENSGDLSDAKVEAKERLHMTTNDSSPHINDCKSVLGSCIVSGDSNDENCLCAQIKTTVDDTYDSNIIPPETINFTNSAPVLQPCEVYKPINNIVTDAGCDGCVCSGYLQNEFGTADRICLTTSSQNTRNRSCPQNNGNINSPNIEYKLDGSIKLKDTFDADIKVFESKKSENKENRKVEPYNSLYVPFNSCKAVLGKCIVSGNGTISEECLCAKMLIEDQQVTAEEIDEITPHPTISTINLSVI